MVGHSQIQSLPLGTDLLTATLITRKQTSGPPSAMPRVAKVCYWPKQISFGWFKPQGASGKPGASLFAVIEFADMRAKIEIGHQWGNWTLGLTKGEYYLAFRSDAAGRHRRYEIDLNDIKDSAGMLDWIFQIHMKAPMTPADVHDLLSAFKDIFKPQANLCSFGEGKKLKRGFLESRIRPVN